MGLAWRLHSNKTGLSKTIVENSVLMSALSPIRNANLNIKKFLLIYIPNVSIILFIAEKHKSISNTWR